MAKKRIALIVLLFSYTSICFAEGQYGLARFMNFIQLLFICFWILAFTMFGGIIVKFILQKNKLFIKNQTLKAFSIAFLITIAAMLIFGDDFLFSLWNNT
ncbi:hypothetical protein Q9Q97_00455 [Flavobacterium sp. DG2-3]|nr:hypothetical protein [Flavobacterium sp. DG2-3]